MAHPVVVKSDMPKQAERLPRTIEVRRTLESDDPGSAAVVLSQLLFDSSSDPIAAVLRALADALHADHERDPRWTIQVIYHPKGVPTATKK